MKMKKATELQEFSRSYNWLQGVIRGWLTLLNGNSYCVDQVKSYLTEGQYRAWLNARNAIRILSEEMTNYKDARAIYDKEHESNEAS